jgi:ribosomal protein S12
VHVGTVEVKSREHGIQARGAIQTDGSFTLSTYEEGDGAVAGAHDCVIVQFVMAEDLSGHRPSTIGVIDRRYASYATSGLAMDVSPDEPNKVVLEVEGIRSKQPDQHEH